MTDGYLCDRCGEFTPSKVPIGGIRSVNLSDEEYREIAIGFRHGEDNSGFKSTTYDLCEGCRKKLDSWIENPGPSSGRLDKEHHNAPKDANDDPVIPDGGQPGRKGDAREQLASVTLEHGPSIRTGDGGEVNGDE